MRHKHSVWLLSCALGLLVGPAAADGDPVLDPVLDPWAAAPAPPSPRGQSPSKRQPAKPPRKRPPARPGATQPAHPPAMVTPGDIVNPWTGSPAPRPPQAGVVKDPWDAQVGRAGTQRWLGVELQPLSAQLRTHFGAPVNGGVLVSEVAEGGLAELAGLKAGDVLIKIDDQVVTSQTQLRGWFARKGSGDRIRFTVMRNRLKLVRQLTIPAQRANANQQQARLNEVRALRSQLNSLRTQMGSLAERLEQLESHSGINTGPRLDLRQ